MSFISRFIGEYGTVMLYAVITAVAGAAAAMLKKTAARQMKENGEKTGTAAEKEEKKDGEERETAFGIFEKYQRPGKVVAVQRL